MRGIIVDDEPLMIEAFKRLSSGIENLKLEGAFESAEEAIEFSENHSFEIAFLDIELPEMNGIECAKALREKMPGILIVFISAYDDYLRESNQIGGDDYIVKPYRKETIEKTMDKMRLLVQRQKKKCLCSDVWKVWHQKRWCSHTSSGKGKRNTGTDPR